MGNFFLSGRMRERGGGGRGGGRGATYQGMDEECSPDVRPR